ncbi:MAG: MarR family winged helix-turn-helix transcriptional regulator [Holophagales bacterium]|nr:MarR family winged helix-turn-helix transcriptional regulator [Holophagales bacterium]
MPPYFETHNPPTSQRIASGLGKLSSAIRQKSWEEALPRSLTPTQGQVLTLLASRPGLGLAQVADALGVRPPTASDAVRVLAEKGLVSKSKRPDDARALHLHLTAEGQETAELASRWPDFLASAVEELPAADQRSLLRAVITLIRTLQERGQIPVASMCVTCEHFRPFVHSDPRLPHHCAFVDAAFGDSDLRLDCPEHEAAPGSRARANWQRFAEAGKSPS